MSAQHELLLQQGIQAAEDGDHEQANDLLKQVIEQDETNVEAWVWLSRVVEDKDEQRICLSTILQLEPGNEYAKTALQEMDQAAEKGKAEEEYAPGISRRLVRLTIIGGAIYVFLICMITLLITSSVNNSKNVERQSLTAAANQLRETQSAIAEQDAEIVMQQTQAILDVTETAVASITPTSNAPTLPPTWTAAPTEGAASLSVLDAPPDFVPGSIISWRGRDSTNRGFLELHRIPISGGESTRINNDQVLYPVIDADGTKIAYMRYSPSLATWTLEQIGINDPNSPEDLEPKWAGQAVILEPQMPRYSTDGGQMVFVGTSQETGTTEIFLLNLVANAIQQITSDDANYTFPALSPNGTSLVAVREDGSGADLVLIDITNPADFTQVKLTEDGSAITESVPVWHPDGQQIAYSATSAASPGNSDINVMLIVNNARGAVTPVIASPDDEIYPVYSPDGQYIAFASNPVADYDIFIYQIQTRTIWQLTAEEFDAFPGSWASN